MAPSSQVSQRPPRVSYAKSGAFHQDLSQQVGQYFEKISKRDDPRFYRKAAVVVSWLAISYALVFWLDNPWLQALACVSLGVSMACAGFNLFHDSIHGSVSNKSWVNKTMAYVTCSILGSSRYLWAYKHNFLHHSYPNILGFDDDLETRGVMRLSPEQAWSKKFRYQHIWGWIAYALSTLEWIFIKDFVQYFTLSMNPYQRIPKFKPKEKLEFWTVYLATGLTLSLIFQLAHVAPNCEFPVPVDEKGTMAQDYYWVQMAATTNFARENAFVNWFSGGLNFQVEHHLYPQVTHTHYPALAKIVSELAHKHGIPYNSFKTYREAFVAHCRQLRTLGFNEDKTVQSPLPV
jgi:linoleoyl-CoA desaturase